MFEENLLYISNQHCQMPVYSKRPVLWVNHAWTFIKVYVVKFKLWRYTKNIYVFNSSIHTLQNKEG